MQSWVQHIKNICKYNHCLTIHIFIRYIKFKFGMFLVYACVYYVMKHLDKFEMNLMNIKYLKNIK